MVEIRLSAQRSGSESENTISRILTLSASWILAMTSPVAGLRVGKVFPLTELTHSLLMNNWKGE